MTTLEQLNLSQPLTDVYTAMETDLMMAIARQLAAGGEINATSEWRLKKLAEAGALSKETVQIIASYTGIQSDLITETIEGAAMGVADRLEPALQACARDGYISAVGGTPISESMKNVVTNFRSQAKTDLNLVNTVMQYKANSAYKNLVNKIYDDTKRQELLGVLGKHTLEVASGGTSRQEAVRNCIKEFSQKGIPAFVDKRGREWSPEAYINMDIRTTVNNTANAAQDACCDKYGLDLIQVSSHMGARPKCAIDQGKLYSRSNRSGIAHDGDGNEIPFYPWSSTSYGQPDGILGINCHHHKYPFADGVNFQRYFPYDKDENEERYKEFQNSGLWNGVFGRLPGKQICWRLREIPREQSRQGVNSANSAKLIEITPKSMGLLFTMTDLLWLRFETGILPIGIFILLHLTNRVKVV